MLKFAAKLLAIDICMQQLDLVMACLNEMKASDIVLLEVSSLTSITDHMIICTGRSGKHIQSIAEKLIEQCKENNIRPVHASGFDSDDWIIVDCLDFIVHLFVQQARDFYQLEKLWSVNTSVKNQEA